MTADIRARVSEQSGAVDELGRGRGMVLALGLAAIGGAALVGTCAAFQHPGLAAAAIVTAVSGVACVALQTRRLQRTLHAATRLERLSLVDPESTLPGPHALYEELAAELDRSRTTGRPLSVVMVTIDDQRALHLERGLAAGQQLVRQTADALQSAVLPFAGRAYRAHGTAVVALLPATSHAEAERVAQRVGPALSLLARRNGNLVHLVAGGAVALAGDLPEDLLVRAERRCARARAGLVDDLAQVLRPLSSR